MNKLYTSTGKDSIVTRGMQKTAAIYIRVSSDEQIQNSSIETQIEHCRKKIKSLDATEVGIFIEEGESAKTSERTQFQNLLEFVTRNKNNVDYVVVYKIDRWARNTSDHLFTKTLLLKLGCNLISVIENIEDTPTGRFIEVVMAASAQLDNELKGMRVKDCMAKKAQDGWPQNKVCYGYLNHPTKKITVPHPIYYKPIKDILLRFLDGESISELTKYLNSLGLKTKGSKRHIPRPFIPKDIWKILTKSKFYAGYFDHKDYKDIKGKYAPMITPDQHLQIQSKLFKKPIINIMNTDDLNTFILNFKLRRDLPFMVCGNCKKRMRTMVASGNGGKYPIYCCNNSQCLSNSKSIWKVKLEALIENEIKNMLPSIELVKAFKTIVGEEWEKEYEMRIVLEKQSEEKLQYSKIDKTKTIEMYKKGLLDEEGYKEEMQRIEIEQVATQRTYNENRIDKAELEMLLTHAELFLRSLKPLYTSASIDNKRRLLEILFPQGINYINGDIKTNGKSLLFEVLEEISNKKTNENQNLTLQGIEPWFAG